MKVWLPYIHGGSGTDVFTDHLARGLARAGHDSIPQALPHHFQYAPWLVGAVAAPRDTDIIVANTWNAFAFHRAGSKLVAVEHLFVLDPALAPYKSHAQAAFHSLLVKRFEQATQRRADRVVAVSQYTANAYANGLCVPKPSVIINGIDTEFFTPASGDNTAFPSRPFRLLFVGNISRRKGADLIPAIMERLDNSVELSYTAGLRQADPFPNLPRVRKLGRLDHAGVRAEYRRADALLFPTRLEGLPLVAIEAMACGTPVIACNTASIPEVVAHEQNGMLCGLDDPASFATAIIRLRDNQALLARLALNAQRCARAHFSLERMVRDYLQLFAQLMG